MHPKNEARGNYLKFPIKCYCLQDLANIYQTSKFILRKRLKAFKEQIGKAEAGYKYSPRQVELIFTLVPLPSGVYFYKRYKKRE